MKNKFDWDPKPRCKDFPLLWFTILGISFGLWNNCSICWNICETEPYILDGEAPLHFIQFGFFEVIFECKWLFKLIYKRKHGYTPKGLE